MENNIISIEDLKMVGRPLGKMVQDHKLYAFIQETESLYIKPKLGDDLFITLVENANEVNPADGRLKILLEGGIYDPKDYGRDEPRRCFDGLKKAISYFVYAENVMSGNVESTRYGFNIKNDDYSNNITDKTRSSLYNNIIDKAKGFLGDCLTFCKISGLIKDEGKSKINVGGCVIRKIG